MDLRCNTWLSSTCLAVRYHTLSSSQASDLTYVAFSEDASADRVAIGVQGSCRDLSLWSDVLANQHHYHQIHFYFLMFDEEPEVCPQRSAGADTSYTMRSTRPTRHTQPAGIRQPVPFMLLRKHPIAFTSTGCFLMLMSPLI